MTLNYSDEQLCKMAKNPKEKEWAFKMILKIYQERLYALIRRMVGTHEDTDDILQNTFLKVYKYINTFENKSSLYKPKTIMAPTIDILTIDKNQVLKNWLEKSATCHYAKLSNKQNKTY